MYNNNFIFLKNNRKYCTKKKIKKIYMKEEVLYLE